MWKNHIVIDSVYVKIHFSGPHQAREPRPALDSAHERERREVEEQIFSFLKTTKKSQKKSCFPETKSSIAVCSFCSETP